MSKGFGDAIRKLEELGQRAQQLNGTHSIPANRLFSSTFMVRYTDFSSFQAMLEASGFKVESEDDFRAIPDDEWETFVGTRTRFTSWDAMQRKAGEEWITNELKL
jgi:hypothetical protein